MKKFFMFLAVAGFFSMTTISCGGDKTEGDATHEEDGHDHDHEEGDGHDHAH